MKPINTELIDKMADNSNFVETSISVQNLIINHVKIYHIGDEKYVFLISNEYVLMPDGTVDKFDFNSTNLNKYVINCKMVNENEFELLLTNQKSMFIELNNTTTIKAAGLKLLK